MINCWYDFILYKYIILTINMTLTILFLKIHHTHLYFFSKLQFLKGHTFEFFLNILILEKYLCDKWHSRAMGHWHKVEPKSVLDSTH